MRKLLLTLSLALMTVGTFAVPAKPGVWRTITLADGTEVRAQLSGDENTHFWATEEGKFYVETSDGNFAPFSMEQLKSTAASRAAQKPRKGMRRVTPGERTHFTGQKRGLVILVQFTDVKFKDANNKEKYNKILNQEGYTSSEGFKGCVSDYFKAQSGGEFELVFDVVGPYDLKYSQSYYGSNNSQGEDQRPDDMIVEAVKAANAEVDFKDYDWDGDKYVDQVYVLYAGMGEADGGGAKTIWPHEYELIYTNKALKLDGVTINTYACSNEVKSSGRIDGIGTFCHEFSHCMGLPDFYDTKYEGILGTGDYDLMCGGAYNGSSFVPAGYTAYEKMMSGWLEPIELGDEDVTVENLKASTEGGESYIIYNKAHPDEFYMIENRQLKGWDAKLPGKGLMVTHVDFDKKIWQENSPNTMITSADFQYGYSKTNDHVRMNIVRADNDDDKSYWSSYGGYFTKSTESTDLYPYKKNDSLTRTSKPATMLYNKNTDGTKFLTGALLNIKQNSDGTMSFKYRAKEAEQEEPVIPVEPDPEMPEGAIFYESFSKCSGTGGNDGLWSGQIASSTFAADNEGWVSDKKYAANKCARFGTASVAAVATTPQFDLDGEATFSFKAGAWGNEGTTLTLSVNGDATIEPTEVTIGSSQWSEHTVTLMGSGPVSVTFAAEKRMFLDELVAMGTTPTGISNIRVKESTVGIFTLDGRYVGQDLSTLRNGIYIVNGHKVIK